MYRSLATVTTTTSTTTTTKDDDDGASSSSSTSSTAPSVLSCASHQPLSDRDLYLYLGLEKFTTDELGRTYDRILQSVGDATKNSGESDSNNNSTTNTTTTTTTMGITAAHVEAFLWQHRLPELEAASSPHAIQQQQPLPNDISPDMDEDTLRRIALRKEFCQLQSRRLWKALVAKSNSSSSSSSQQSNLLCLTRNDFVDLLDQSAHAVNMQRVYPIAGSMVLVGASVGVTMPAMPVVVETLGLSASQYGLAVSAFALAKMAANVPSAIAIERYGRKPFMVKSLVVIALGVGGIGLAGSFEELYLFRFLTGAGVSFLSGAATLMMADLSTPLNRASTIAPVSSGFSAGTALGPAIGGVMLDSLGLQTTFALVGLSFLGVAGLNRTILQETKPKPPTFPWQQPQLQPPTTTTTTQSTAVQQSTTDNENNNSNNNNTKAPPPDDSLSGALQNAVGQWIPLMNRPAVRDILFVNGVYWVALAGSQMTLLPLLITDPNGLNMSATDLGHCYMGMSTVQILGTPVFARIIDRVGTAPAIVAGCACISTGMATLPLCAPDQWLHVAATLGLWATGSSMLSTAPVSHLLDKVEDHERAQANALLRTCGDVGFLGGAIAAGALADWAGSIEWAMQSNAGLLFATTLWFGARQSLIIRGDKNNKNNNNNSPL